MNEEITIAEIKKLLIEVGEQYYQTNVDRSCASFEALALYDAGYRKQSETVKEFAGKLKDYLKHSIFRTKGEDCKESVYEIIERVAEQYGKED